MGILIFIRNTAMHFIMFVKLINVWGPGKEEMEGRIRPPPFLAY